MKCIFWTCFGWIASCFMPHNKFIFCSTWISKTSGASLASSRARWLATQKWKHAWGFRKWNPTPVNKIQLLGKTAARTWAGAVSWAPLSCMSSRFPNVKASVKHNRWNSFSAFSWDPGFRQPSHQTTDRSHVTSSLGQHPLTQANVRDELMVGGEFVNTNSRDYTCDLVVEHISITYGERFWSLKKKSRSTVHVLDVQWLGS